MVFGPRSPGPGPAGPSRAAASANSSGPRSPAARPAIRGVLVRRGPGPGARGAPPGVSTTCPLGGAPGASDGPATATGTPVMQRPVAVCARAGHRETPGGPGGAVKSPGRGPPADARAAPRPAVSAGSGTSASGMIRRCRRFPPPARPRLTGVRGLWLSCRSRDSVRAHPVPI